MLLRALAIALTITGAAWAPAWAARPVLVELYTAQGCQACTKANGLADELSQRDGVLALTFPVDYWDYLGWTDTFAKPEFTARQKTYMRRLRQRDVFTPQVVVDGRAQASAARTDRIDALVKDAARARASGRSLKFFGGGFVRVDAGTAPKGGADVWLIRYDPKPDPVEVKAGETEGQTLAYANVVREMVRLGGWTGKRRTFALPEAGDHKLKTLILLQAAKGGRVLDILER
jgi:hypothetical protein